MMQDGGKKKQKKTQKAGVKTPRAPTAAPKPSTRSTISKEGVAHPSSHRKPTKPLVSFGSLTPYERPAAPLVSFGSVQSIKDDGLVRAMSMGGKKKTKSKGGDPPPADENENKENKPPRRSRMSSARYGSISSASSSGSYRSTQGNPEIQDLLSGVLEKIDAEKRTSIAKMRSTWNNKIEAAFRKSGGKKKTKQ